MFRYFLHQPVHLMSMTETENRRHEMKERGTIFGCGWVGERNCTAKRNAKFHHAFAACCPCCVQIRIHRVRILVLNSSQKPNRKISRPIVYEKQTCKRLNAEQHISRLELKSILFETIKMWDSKVNRQTAGNWIIRVATHVTAKTLRNTETQTDHWRKFLM